jgi:hypothetical protein
VSPGMAGCHGGGLSRAQPIGATAGLATTAYPPVRLFNDLAVWQDDNDRPTLFEAKADS